MTAHDDLFGFLNSLLKVRRRDSALVDIEEGDVVVGDLMKKDDELDEICVRLLPEGFLSLAEKIVEKRGDVESQRVGVKVVVKRVVAILRIQTDFDIVFASAMRRQDALDLAAKIALHFENEPADSLFLIVTSVGKNLLGKWIHAATGLARTDCTENGDAREESALGNGEPKGRLGRNRFARVVHFAKDKEEVLSFARVYVP